MNVALTNSPITLETDVVDQMIAEGRFASTARYPAEQRARVRRIYVDTAIGEVRKRILKYNESQPTKKTTWRIPTMLSEANIVRIICEAENARRLRSDPRIDTAQSALALYNPDTGVYTYDPAYHTDIIAQYMPTSYRVINGALKLLAKMAPGGLINQNPNLINFANGVLDRTNKKLLKHDPKYMFTNSLAVNYNPNATNKHMTCDDGSDWDVESWMRGLSDDPSVVDLLWEVVAACLRPGERWNKTPWLYSVVGANGKGSLCELIRRIVGATATASLTVADFGTDYMVGQLMNTTCVVTDENPVGTVIDKLSLYKAAVTGDIFSINRKYQDPIRFTYNGLILQCMNSMPQARDRTGSFYRRQLFIPMEKNFAGVDKPEIKRDFLTNQEVCEYVAKRCMDMEFRSFSNPARCAEVLDEYKTYNDICREFFQDVIEDIPWDFIPNQLALDLYKKWMERNYSGQRPLGRNKFLADFRQAAKDLGGWVVPNQNVRTDTSKFDFTEECSLLYEYDLSGWNCPSGSSDPAKIRSMASTLNPASLKGRMCGIVRDPNWTPQSRTTVVDYDESLVTYIVADQLIDTNANLRRDYGLANDDTISSCVAKQLDADPHCADVVPDLDIDQFIIEMNDGLSAEDNRVLNESLDAICAVLSFGPTDKARLIQAFPALSGHIVGSTS